MSTLIFFVISFLTNQITYRGMGVSGYRGEIFPRHTVTPTLRYQCRKSSLFSTDHFSIPSLAANSRHGDTETRGHGEKTPRLPLAASPRQESKKRTVEKCLFLDPFSRFNPFSVIVLNLSHLSDQVRFFDNLPRCSPARKDKFKTVGF